MTSNENEWLFVFAFNCVGADEIVVAAVGIVAAAAVAAVPVVVGDALIHRVAVGPSSVCAASLRTECTFLDVGAKRLCRRRYRNNMASTPSGCCVRAWSGGDA